MQEYSRKTGIPTIEAINELIDKIEDETIGLNQRAQAADDLIRAVNTRLSQAGVGIEYWHPLACDPEHRQDGVHVGYAKVCGKWQLGGRLGNLDNTKKPLLDTNRFTRIMAAHAMPEFLFALRKKVRTSKAMVIVDSNGIESNESQEGTPTPA